MDKCKIKTFLFKQNMKPSPRNIPIIHSVEIDSNQRWSIYHRLQELEIPCSCSTNKPLQVELNNPIAIAQLCCVVKQSTASRRELIDWLDDCWRVKTKHRKDISSLPPQT